MVLGDLVYIHYGNKEVSCSVIDLTKFTVTVEILEDSIDLKTGTKLQFNRSTGKLIGNKKELVSFNKNKRIMFTPELIFFENSHVNTTKSKRLQLTKKEYYESGYRNVAIIISAVLMQLILKLIGVTDFSTSILIGLLVSLFITEIVIPKYILSSSDGDDV